MFRSPSGPDPESERLEAIKQHKAASPPKPQAKHFTPETDTPAETNGVAAEEQGHKPKLESGVSEESLEEEEDSIHRHERRYIEYQMEEVRAKRIQDELHDMLSSLRTASAHTDEVLAGADQIMKGTKQFLIGHLLGIPEEQLTRKIKETFREIDADKNGTLDRDEVGRAFAKMGRTLTKSELDVWLAEMDADGNGVVDMAEFEHMTRILLEKKCGKGCMLCYPKGASSKGSGVPGVPGAKSATPQPATKKLGVKAGMDKEG
mmetsp:Transcript_32636/g.50778  ORF Transcript_32636/g.50778 Transcript_32636/m.50778 type:complete len:262 (+) Transcript_32636:108-893(+)